MIFLELNHLFDRVVKYGGLIILIVSVIMA